MISHKLDLMKGDVLKTVRDEHRGLHIELIRQFEIQQEIISGVFQANRIRAGGLDEENKQLRSELADIQKNHY